MIDRRTFIAKNFFSLLGLFQSVGVLDFSAFQGKYKRCVIVYSDGMHPKLHEEMQEAKAEERIALNLAKMKLIQSIREEGFPVILVDGGNMICPLTSNNFPEVDSEYTITSLMQYDAAIPGESELASGIHVWKKIAHQIKISWLACNYIVKDTPFEKLVKPFIVKDFGGIRIGITGIGMEQREGAMINGWETVQFIPPVIALNRTAAVLKERGCDWIICFNHGSNNFKQTNSMDAMLAKESELVDLIFGCHVRNSIPVIRLYTNKSGKKTAVFQINDQENFLARFDLILPVKGGNKGLTFNELTQLKKNAE